MALYVRLRYSKIASFLGSHCLSYFRQLWLAWEPEGGYLILLYTFLYVCMVPAWSARQREKDSTASLVSMLGCFHRAAAECGTAAAAVPPLSHVRRRRHADILLDILLHSLLLPLQVHRMCGGGGGVMMMSRLRRVLLLLLLLHRHLLCGGG